MIETAIIVDRCLHMKEKGASAAAHPTSVLPALGATCNGGWTRKPKTKLSTEKATAT
jgi:hypothetical protein